MTQLIGAVEAGGTKFVLALARSDGTVLAETRIATRTPAECFADVGAFFDQASAAHGPIAAFGVASFGPIDIDPASPRYGTILNTSKTGWQGARYHDVLGRFGVPIVVDSDVNGAALGEWRHGAGQHCATLAYTTVGTGVGSGVISQGRSLRGFSHYETGHIAVIRNPDDSFAGHCPFHGDCLEGMVAGPAIKARWGQSLSELADPVKTDQIASFLAQLALNLVLLHMPDRLIFGGGVMKSPGLIEALRRETERRLGGYLSAPQLDAGLESYIVTPGLGDAAGITGAIALAQDVLEQIHG